MTMTIKERLHQACLHQLQLRLEGLAQRLQDLQESLAQATKSSAGDKYETSRAMVHLEQEKLLQQQALLRQQQQQLQRLSPLQQDATVQLGSLVETNKGSYYVSVPLGKVELDGQRYYALSLAAPLGQQLAGKAVGDQFLFNGQSFQITALH